MYFLQNFYSNEAWEAWKRGRVSESHRVATSKIEDIDAWEKLVQFDAVNTFEDLVERVAFLQLMNKRYVLYFRGENRKYDTYLPSIFRNATDLEELTRRWTQLTDQARAWRAILEHEQHPRQRTLLHYPQTLWAVQQHYKDLLDEIGIEGATTPFLDVTHSLRVAASFATDRTKEFKGSFDEDAYVLVIALPQTAGSITFDADEQLQILRLSALCPPHALRPSVQEGYLVARFPIPDPADRAQWTSSYWGGRVEFFSPRRRLVAMIPIRPHDGSFDEFWKNRPGFTATDLLTDGWFASLAARLLARISGLSAREDDQGQ